MPLTPDGRRRLREAAKRNQPWLRSTGPRTEAGKAKAASNARTHGRRSFEAIRAQRQQQANLRWMRALLAMMARNLQADMLADGQTPHRPPTIPHVRADLIDVTIARRAIRAAEDAIRWGHPSGDSLRAFLARMEGWRAKAERAPRQGGKRRGHGQ